MLHFEHFCIQSKQWLWLHSKQLFFRATYFFKNVYFQDVLCMEMVVGVN